MPDFCAAVGCSNERNAETKQQGITFHRFPKDQVRRKAWTTSLRRRDFEPKDSSIVCSCHFKSEDFDRTGQTTRLKEGVIPSILIFPDHLRKVPSSTSRLSRKSAAETPDSLDQPSEEQEEPTPDHQYALDPVIDETTRLTEAQEKVLELQRDLRNAMDRERRHRKTMRSLLQDLEHKDLLTGELQGEFDFYSGEQSLDKPVLDKPSLDGPAWNEPVESDLDESVDKPSSEEPTSGSSGSSVTTRLTEVQEKVSELQQDLRNAMDRERRHRKKMRSLLQDLEHKELLTEELQEKFDFYSDPITGSTRVRGRINKTERTGTPNTKLPIAVQRHGVLPPLQQCVQCCNKYHCPLCTTDMFKPTKHSACKKHLLLHQKRAVHHKGYDIYKCHLPCVPNAHFHCAYCTLTYSRRDGIIDHLTKCQIEQSLDEPVLDEPSLYQSMEKPSLDELVLDKSMDKPSLDEPIDKSDLGEPMGAPVWNEPALDESEEKPSPEEPTSKEKELQVNGSTRVRGRINKTERTGTPNTKLPIAVQRHGVLPPLQQCVQCCNKYHCPLCTTDMFKPTKHSACKKHLLSHKKRAVHHKGYDIYKCHLPCVPNAHFHCAYCTLTYSRRDGIIDHLTKCQSEQSLDEPVLDDPSLDESMEKPSLDELVLDKTSLDEPIDESDLGEPMDAPVWSEPALDESEYKLSSEEPTSKEKELQVNGSTSVRGRINKTERTGTPNTKLPIAVQRHGVLPPLQQCVQCCDKYHCPLCTTDMFKLTKHSACKKHLLAHKKRAVHHKGYDIYKCHLPCVPNAHFHCAYCTLTYSRRDGIIYHLTKCKSEQSLDKPSLDEPVLNEPIHESDLDEPMEPTLDESLDKLSSKEPTSKKKALQVRGVKSVCCHLCGLMMNAKNLKKHLQRKHSEDNIMDITPASRKRSVSLDSTNPDILKRARWTEPVLRTEGVVTIDLDSWKRDQTIQPPKDDQSLDEPEDAPVWNESASDEEPTSKKKVSQVGGGSKVKSVCCPQCGLTMKAKNMKKHLQRKHSDDNIMDVTPASCKRSEPDLDEPDGEPMDEPDWNEPTTTEKASQVRGSKGRSVCCPQCGLTMNAKNLKKHLQRKHSKSNTSYKRSKPLDCMDPDIFKQTRWTEAALYTEDVVTTALAAAIYPPKGDLMKRMVEYTFNHKKLPATLPEELRRITDYPKSLIPPENLCSVCPGAGPLTDPILITSNAQIVTADGIIEDISTYCKMCCKCGMFYRYQQFEDGLHNFNDSILLGLHFCLYLRAHLQNNQSIGSVIQALEYHTEVKFPSAESIRHGYLHFEALSNHVYSYNCVRCGDHPPVVIMDLHKKGVVNISETDLKAPSEGYKGEVHIEDFWDSVSKHMIARGFLICNEENPFKVPPSFESWAPWIGPKTRRSSLVLNTEFQKLHAAPDEEAELHTTDGLVDELVNQEVEVVRTLCKECGLDTTGSMLDLVLRLKDGMRSRATYNKVFEQIWGASGGWAAVLCPCGIVYSLKVLLKGESPQDFTDLLLSWKHIPNVCVYDRARGLARHTNSREPDHIPFGPHEGQLLYPTPKVIQDAKEGKINVNLPWLSKRKIPPDMDCHPCTGSSEHYVLSNIFCERNSSDPKDVLRRASLVPQLASLLNTQVVEQFFEHMREADSFLNDAASETYMFLLRNVLHHRNMRLNKETATLISKRTLEQQQLSAASQPSLMCSYRFITL